MYAVQRSLGIIIDSSKIECLYHNPLLESQRHNCELENQLPFRKYYSIDGGKLFKIISINFLIYETLLQENDLYLKEFIIKISPETLFKTYKFEFSISEFLIEGQQLVDNLHVFLLNIEKFSATSTYADINANLTQLSPHITRIIAYYRGLD